MFQRHTPGPGYSSTYAVVFFCVQYLKWEVVVGFVVESWKKLMVTSIEQSPVLKGP
jgi:hypothetical protein